MYGDALKEFLYPLEHCIAPRGLVIINNICNYISQCVSNIQLGQHTFGHNNISVFTVNFSMQFLIGRNL